MSRPRRAYKEIRLQQLRSFNETARLGSLAAAAGALGVTQPTVWEQVHSLEREFGAQLIEPHGRGCRLTGAGRLLAELIAPVVAGADSLKQAFQDRQAEVEGRVTVVAPQRILVEDLTEAVVEFRRRYPKVLLRLLERPTGQVALGVESGEADLGITSEREGGASSPRLQLEPAYQLDVLLIMPHDHPLARRKRVEPRHLRGYTLVNAPEGISRPEVALILSRLGLFETQPRQVEAVSTAAVRHYVELGFGIGLVLGRPSRERRPRLHEISMSRFFARAGISLIWRKGVVPSRHARAFADTVKGTLSAE